MLYKTAAHVIARPFTHIINVSISKQQYPSSWKRSLISPVPKSYPVCLDDLRPISLLPVLSKICEKMVLDSGISEKFRQSFGQFQFGNVPQSSTASALICIHETITRALDDDNNAGVAI